jgi:hypothetical protein
MSKEAEFAEQIIKDFPRISQRHITWITERIGGGKNLVIAIITQREKIDLFAKESRKPDLGQGTDRGQLG